MEKKKKTQRVMNESAFPRSGVASLWFSLRGSASPRSLPPFLHLIRFVCNLTVPAPALTPPCLAAALDPMYYSPLRKWDLNPARVGCEGGRGGFVSTFLFSPPPSKEQLLCITMGTNTGWDARCFDGARRLSSRVCKTTQIRGDESSARLPLWWGSLEGLCKSWE